MEIPFHYLARAVIIEDGQILLAHAKKSTNTFLPGGHVEPGESVITTIERELHEELGFDCRVGNYLGAVEHSWFQQDIEHFEMNHLFETKIFGVQGLTHPESKEDHLEFYWAPIDDLETYNLQPYPLVALIKNRLKSNAAGAWWGTSLR